MYEMIAKLISVFLNNIEAFAAVCSALAAFYSFKVSSNVFTYNKEVELKRKKISNNIVEMKIISSAMQVADIIDSIEIPNGFPDTISSDLRVYLKDRISRIRNFAEFDNFSICADSHINALYDCITSLDVVASELSPFSEDEFGGDMHQRLNRLFVDLANISERLNPNDPRRGKKALMELRSKNTQAKSFKVKSF